MSNKVAKLLRQFYSSNNALKYADIIEDKTADNWSRDINVWIDIATRETPHLPIVLPSINSDGKIVWYAGAVSDNAGKRLTEELQAFIGPSYSNFDMQLSGVDKSNPVELSFSKLCPACQYRFSATTVEDIPKIRRALLIYAGLVKRYQPVAIDPIENFGQIRAQFDRAILAGDEDVAREKYEKLIRTGRLSADNRLFLEIRLLAGLGRWPQIANDRKLIRNVSDLNVPPRVLSDVIESVYRVHIEPFEDSDDGEKIIDAFKDSGLSSNARLFSTRKGILVPRVLKSFLLYECTRSVLDLGRVESISILLRGVLESDFVKNVCKTIDFSGPTSTPDLPAEVRADEAFENDEFDRALALYVEANRSEKRLRRLISCGLHVDHIESIDSVLKIIDEQHQEDLSGLSESAMNSLEKLRTIASNSSEGLEGPNLLDPHKGWLEWANWVSNGVGHDDAVDILQQCSVNWTVDSICEDQKKVEELAQLIGNANDLPATVFREAYPILYETFVVEHEGRLRQLKPLLNILLTNTILLDSPTQDELELVRQITVCMLNAGLDRQEYSELIIDIENLLDYQVSPAILCWGIDMAEIFSVFLQSEPEAVLRLFIKVLDIAQKLSHRLSPVHMSGLRLLSQDFGYELPKSLSQAMIEIESESSERYDSLNDKTIAIYTLTEHAGQRSAEILKKLCSSVTVKINQDKVCTKRLAGLAKTVDIFVFAWKSSKHQAYYCVKDNRSSDLPILQPLGKGSSSIVREIVENSIVA